MEYTGINDYDEFLAYGVRNIVKKTLENLDIKPNPPKKRGIKI